MTAIRTMILGLVLALPVPVGSLSATSFASPPEADLSCVGIDPPSDGVVTNRFEPGPGYEGHWGIDYSGDSDGYAGAAAGGRVSFVGHVVDNLAVTVDHGGGLLTSYSYLGGAMVARGQRVGRGNPVGQLVAGPLHDDLHFSVRIDGEYIDPETVLGCQPRSPSAGLRLVPVNPGEARSPATAEHRDGAADRAR